MQNAVIISGCSGGGKSTLIAELAARGYAVIEEPGRRIVSEERAGEGLALPWVSLEKFAHKAIALARRDLETIRASRSPWIFVDRGLVDAYAALARATGRTSVTRHLRHEDRFHSTVFLAPPWPEIHRMDGERQSAFHEAIAEYEMLSTLYPALGYSVILLPKLPVSKRADFVLASLNAN